MLLHAFGILCGLSLTVLATFAARPAGAVALGAGFALAWIALPRGIVPDPVWFGLLLAAGAALGLWARGSLPAAAIGGVAGALWLRVLEAQGAPPLLAFVLVAAVAAAAAIASRRRAAFASAALRDEALLLAALFALLLAAAPGVREGFDSAVALTAVPLAAEAPPAAPWALAVAAVSVLAGGLYAAWRRR